MRLSHVLRPHGQNQVATHPAGLHQGSLRRCPSLPQRKGADCWRYFLGVEKLKPGRPCKRFAGEVLRVPIGGVVRDEPSPFSTESIDEVWGFRSARALTHCLSPHCLTFPLSRSGTATFPTWTST